MASKDSGLRVCSPPLWAGWFFQPFFSFGVVEERRFGSQVHPFPLPAFPLVLGNVYDDAVEIGGQRGFAAKLGQRAVEPQKDLLREIFDVGAHAGQSG